MDEKSIVIFDKTRVYINQVGHQLFLRDYRDSVDSLIEAIKQYETQPIEETADKLQEFNLNFC
jgi:hypothetical protein